MFNVTTKVEGEGSTLDADVTGDTTSSTPAFVTEQSVTSFAAMAAVIQLVWQAFQKGAGTWADSVWLALGISVIVGIALTAPLFNDLKRPPGDWVKAIIFAGINTMVLWATALGIESELVE